VVIATSGKALTAESMTASLTHLLIIVKLLLREVCIPTPQLTKC